MSRFFSPAKINFFLYVTGRRVDGYHELCSLLHTIDYGDHLTLAFSEEEQWSCSLGTLPMDHRNLIVQALHIFRKETGLHDPVSIHLDKHIPMQAGLGGGSSNAATMLWALNELYRYPVDLHTLQVWGAQIGADVPFFFSEGSALCIGIGDRVIPQPPIQTTLFLHCPKEPLSTPQVFQNLTPPYQETGYQLYYNRLEEVALRMMPSLRSWKTSWAPFYDHVFMTGSGSAFLGVGGQHPDGKQVATIVRDPGSWYVDPKESTFVKAVPMIK